MRDPERAKAAHIGRGGALDKSVVICRRVSTFEQKRATDLPKFRVDRLESVSIPSTYDIWLRERSRDSRLVLRGRQ